MDVNHFQVEDLNKGKSKVLLFSTLDYYLFRSKHDLTLPNFYPKS